MTSRQTEPSPFAIILFIHPMDEYETPPPITTTTTTTTTTEAATKAKAKNK